jgi:tRNA-dihydrouridine synthase A
MRHLLQIFAKQPGTKQWKRYLSENGNTFNGGSDIVRQALKQLGISN